MYAFDKKTSFFFVAFCLILIFIPKVNLISFSGRETAGIRIDDIFLMGFSVLFFWGHLASGKKLQNLEVMMLAIISFSLLSFFSNRFLVTIGQLHVQANILYALRIFEYFLFFYIGYYAVRSVNIHTIIFLCFFLNFIVIVLQRLGKMGEWGLYGYQPIAKSRCSGLCSFPSEMGMMLNLFFSYLLFQQQELLKTLKQRFCRHLFYFKVIEKIYPYVLFFLIGFLLVINGSRIAFAAHVVCFLLYLFSESLKKIIFGVGIALSVLFLGSFIYESESFAKLDLISRSQKLFSKNNVDLVKKVWEQIDVRYEPIGKEVIQRSREGEDASWWMRIHKWLYAIKIYIYHPEAYLQGIGPGFAMAGLDGGILRIFVEYGILGFSLYCWFFYTIAQKSKILKYWMLMFVINMCFFDVYLAYKPMALIFLVTGYTYACDFSKTKKIKSEVLL